MEGVNEVKVIGTAEDGSTSEYKVTVVVMPKYEGKVPVIEGAVEKETEPPTEPETETQELTTNQDDIETESVMEVDANVDNDKEEKGVSVVIFIMVNIICLGLGFGVCFVLFKKNVLK